MLLLKLILQNYYGNYICLCVMNKRGFLVLNENPRILPSLKAMGGEF